mmetsp:Transcript_17885/g.21431  ORF Transcript_17885/g.21431 Transcript_17885/m.21431 type:complete len:199 (+) Transcript_17885:162-758(+)
MAFTPTNSGRNTPTSSLNHLLSKEINNIKHESKEATKAFQEMGNQLIETLKQPASSNGTSYDSTLSISDVLNKRKNVDSKDLAQVKLNDQLSQNWEKLQQMKDAIQECEETIEKAKITRNRTLYRATKRSKIVFEKEQDVNLDLCNQWVGQLDLINTEQLSRRKSSVENNDELSNNNLASITNDDVSVTSFDLYSQDE